jgi:hypothetical protein
LQIINGIAEAAPLKFKQVVHPFRTRLDGTERDFFHTNVGEIEQNQRACEARPVRDEGVAGSNPATPTNT